MKKSLIQLLVVISLIFSDGILSADINKGKGAINFLLILGGLWYPINPSKA